MKLGSKVVDLNTGKRGHVVSLPVFSRPDVFQGIWMHADGERIYTRDWRHCGHDKKPRPINPELLELSEKVKREKLKT